MRGAGLQLSPIMTPGGFGNLAQRPEHVPGDAAPAAGTYEQLNICGRPTGVHVDVLHGHPLPPAPIGHNWALADEDASEC